MFASRQVHYFYFRRKRNLHLAAVPRAKMKAGQTDIFLNPTMQYRAVPAVIYYH